MWCPRTAGPALAVGHGSQQARSAVADGLGRPSIRYYPHVSTPRGDFYLAVCADHYAAEAELLDWVSEDETVTLGITTRQVAGR